MRLDRSSRWAVTKSADGVTGVMKGASHHQKFSTTLHVNIEPSSSMRRTVYVTRAVPMDSGRGRGR